MPDESIRIIRVYVSSPGDVKKERDVLPEVVDSINRIDGQAGGFRLELFRWETDVVPQHGPQPRQVIDSQTPAYDIYIGIMSARFGEPSGRYGSGTEQEYEGALKQWKQAGAPWIIFYFDDAPKSLTKPEEIKQYLAVGEFREKLESEGLIATYQGVRGSRDGFFEKVSMHLRQLVPRLISEKTQAASGKKTMRPVIPQEYIGWLLDRCGDVELMGMELKHGERTKLHHVYVPLMTSGWEGGYCCTTSIAILSMSPVRLVRGSPRFAVG